MLHLRCTQKLIKELAPSGYTVAEAPEEIPALHEWYGNIFRVERRKCLLFTHAATLFSCFIPGATKPDFVAIDATFRQNLQTLLQNQKMDVALAEQIAPIGERAQIHKTKSRSVLGSMNDFVFQIEVRIESEGGLARTDLAELNHDLNRVPMGALKYTYPVDAFKELVSRRNQ